MPAEIYPDFSECSTCDRVRPLTIIAVSNQKGGVGKTTTAISLGAALVEQGEHVLIVDLVASGPDMAGAEVELVSVMAREYRLRQALRSAQSYDTVLINCPPSLGLLTINALAAGDEVVIPVQCEYYALEGLAQLLSTIDAVRSRLNSKLEVLAIVLTMEDRRNRLSLQVIEEVRRHFPRLVADSRIPRAVRLAEAPSHGMPISVYDRRSAAAEAYDDLARELATRLKARAPIALGGPIA